MITSLYSGVKGYWFLLLTLVGVLIGGAWLFPGLQVNTRAAVTYGGLISVFLTAAGFILLSCCKGANAGKFIKLVLGGMIARIILALGLIAVGIGLFHLPAGALAGSCLITYVVFSTLEHLYLLPLLTNKGKT
ncbi:MAG TPA: hypothetical protein VM123_09805 [archaeon]|nr:hypothetical protein [archaeon]